MKKKIIATLLATFITLFNVNPAHAQYHVDLDTMFPPVKQNTNIPRAGEANILSTFLNPIVSFVPVLTGILSFIIIIIAGIKYISHAGNAQETKKISDMITYALVGLGLSAIAFWITRLLFMVGAGDAQSIF
jgi:hypothetical protein